MLFPRKGRTAAQQQHKQVSLPAGRGAVCKNRRRNIDPLTWGAENPSRQPGLREGARAGEVTERGNKMGAQRKKTHAAIELPTPQLLPHSLPASGLISKSDPRQASRPGEQTPVKLGRRLWSGKAVALRRCFWQSAVCLQPCLSLELRFGLELGGPGRLRFAWQSLGARRLWRRGSKA